jgi:hypothetical protein
MQAIQVVLSIIAMVLAPLNLENQTVNQPVSPNVLAQSGGWARQQQLAHGDTFRDLEVANGHLVIHSTRTARDLRDLTREPWARPIRVEREHTSVSYNRLKRILSLAAQVRREEQPSSRTPYRVVTTNVPLGEDVLEVGIYPYTEAAAQHASRRFKGASDGLPVRIVEATPISRQ